MTDFTKVEKFLKLNGFQVKVFDTGAEASAYLNEELDGVSIGMGGSKTLDALGLFESLAEHNEVWWHWRQEADLAREKARYTDVYMCSANALSETGEIINVDGNGNRLAGTLWGHKKVIFVIGRNKLAPDYMSAVARCRNVACTTRAADFGEPACVKAGTVGEKCWDCKSPDRACKAMLTIWQPLESAEYEVILIDEDLGY